MVMYAPCEMMQMGPSLALALALAVWWVDKKWVNQPMMRCRNLSRRSAEVRSIACSAYLSPDSISEGRGSPCFLRRPSSEPKPLSIKPG